MEFNKNKSTVSSIETVDSQTDSISLISSSIASTATLPNTVKVKTTSSGLTKYIEFDTNLILLAHKEEDILSSLVTIYSNNAKVYNSAKSIEKIDITGFINPKLEYTVITYKDGIENKYTSSYNVPSVDTVTNLSVTGTTNGVYSTYDTKNAVVKLDEEIYNIKIKLTSLNNIYYSNENKVVSLVELLTDIDNRLRYVEEKIKEI